jgi:hypothetical protein
MIMNHSVGFKPNGVLLCNEPGETEIGSQNKSPDTHEDEYGAGKEAERRVAIGKRTLQEEGEKDQPYAPPYYEIRAGNYSGIQGPRREQTVCLRS